MLNNLYKFILLRILVKINHIYITECMPCVIETNVISKWEYI